MAILNDKSQQKEIDMMTQWGNKWYPGKQSMSGVIRQTLIESSA